MIKRDEMERQLVESARASRRCEAMMRKTTAHIVIYSQKTHELHARVRSYEALKNEPKYEYTEWSGHHVEITQLSQQKNEELFWTKLFFEGLSNSSNQKPHDEHSSRLNTTPENRSRSQPI